MFQDRSLTLLKNIVIIMGVLLIIGVLVIFKLIASQLFNHNKKDCLKQQEILLNDANIINISSNKKKIFIHLKDANNEKIIFFDYCNAQDINEIILNK